MRISIDGKTPLPESWDDFKVLHAQQALQVTHCKECKGAFTPARVWSARGWAETQISYLCEECFDAAARGVER